MPVTAEYSLSLEIEHLRATINASSAWRAVVESPDSDWPTLKALADAATSSEANALAKIVKERTDEGDASQDIPRCIVRHLNDSDVEKIGTGSWNTDGVLMMIFELPIPSAYADEVSDAATHFTNVIGRILEEMEEGLRVSAAGKLNIERISRTVMGQYDPDEVNGRLIRAAEFMVYWAGV